MRFDIEQRFPAPPDAVVAAYTDPDLHRQMVDLGRVERTQLLDVTEDGGVVVVRARFRFKADLPAAALAIIDPDRLTWVDETRYDLAARSSSTRLRPDHYPDRLQASATSRFEPDPTDAGATRRAITGELTVPVPLVGGRVERAIVDGLREHLVAEAAAVAAHLGGATGTN